MNGPPPGNYYIINAAVGNLAANFGANPLNVTDMTPGLMVQQWSVIGNPDAPQAISPLVNLGLQAGPVGLFVEALPPNFAWRMIPGPNGDEFIISNPNAGCVWAINRPHGQQEIVLQPQGTGPFQIWRFLPVP